MTLNSKITPGKYVVYCLLIAALAFIIASGFMGYMSLLISPAVIAGFAFITSAFLYVIYIYPAAGLIAATIMPLSAAVFYLFRKETFIVRAGSVWNIINGCSLWFWDYLYNPVSVNVHYAQITGAVFAVIIASVLFLFIIYWNYPLLTMAAGITIFCVMWFTGYDNAFTHLKQYIFVSFVLYGYINYNYRENSWRLRQDNFSMKTKSVWVICTLCLMLCVYIISVTLPSGMKSAKPGWLDDKVFKRVSDMWYGNGGGKAVNSSVLDDRFDIGIVGYQEGTSKLGGAVKNKNVLLLKVMMDKQFNSPVYLRGSVKDKYTGSLWTKTPSEANTLESNKEITNITGNMEKVKQYNTVGITVYPQRISTTSIFNIWKPYRVNIDEKNYYCSDDGELYLEKPLEKNSVYSVVSKIPVVNYQDLKKVTRNSRREQFEKYLQLPETLPDRVRSLALKITDGYRNNYDKAMAIQNYLRENYPYTLDTSSVPEGRDFVDYFLFDERKGYCSYYASAMAVMCRSAGIPSRYVEGVVLNLKDRDGSGIYNVMSSSAHAWVELYFEGYGWVSFEPTSSYEFTGYTSQDNQAVQPREEQRPSITPAPPKPENQENPKVSDIKNNPTVKVSIPWGILAAAAVLLGVFSRMMLKICSDRNRIENADRLDGKEAAMEYMRIFERKLKLAGIVRDMGETSSEFGHRITDLLLPHSIDSTDIMDSFDKVRFGNGRIDKGTRRKFKDAINRADGLIKEKMGTLRFVIRKYII